MTSKHFMAINHLMAFKHIKDDKGDASAGRQRVLPGRIILAGLPRQGSRQVTDLLSWRDNLLPWIGEKSSASAGNLRPRRENLGWQEICLILLNLPWQYSSQSGIKSAAPFSALRRENMPSAGPFERSYPPPYLPPCLCLGLADFCCSLPLPGVSGASPYHPLGPLVAPKYLGAIGILARDDAGSVLGGFARPVPVSGPASAVEAFAVQAGLEFAATHNWSSVIIESDAAGIVNKLPSPSQDLSLLGDSLVPVHNLLAATSGRVRVCFAPRSANTVAPELATWACRNFDVLSFDSVCPELISTLVLDDLSSSF
ncbi:hypothetical protein V6N13_026585 [Hibiscus sabdariffa]